MAQRARLGLFVVAGSRASHHHSSAVDRLAAETRRCWRFNRPRSSRPYRSHCSADCTARPDHLRSVAASPNGRSHPSAAEAPGLLNESLPSPAAAARPVGVGCAMDTWRASAGLADPTPSEADPCPVTRPRRTRRPTLLRRERRDCVVGGGAQGDRRVRAGDRRECSNAPFMTVTPWARRFGRPATSSRSTMPAGSASWANRRRYCRRQQMQPQHRTVGIDYAA